MPTIYALALLKACTLSLIIEVIGKYREKIVSLENDITEIEAQEREEKELRSTENQMNKAARLLEEKRETEQTKRVWFQTHQQREQEKGWFLHQPIPLIKKKKSVQSVSLSIGFTF